MTDQRVLSHERVPLDGAEPERWLGFLHGIFGAGRNWGTIARRLVQARPDWGGLLVDLREHGGSRGFAPPHSLEAAAADLRALVEHTGLRLAALLGHSFGGKVALGYLRRYGEGLEQLWLVDSTPEAKDPSGSAWEMLSTLRAVPDRFDTRGDAVAALEQHGLETPVAQWIATNLEPAGDDGYRWALDLDAMEALLRDFFRTDLWDVIESPPGACRVHVVKATRSSVLSEAACARIEAAGARNGRTRLHRVEGGHWLNVTSPDTLLDLLEREL